MRNVLHFVVVTILIGLVTVGVYLGLTSLGLMPVQASTQSLTIDALFDLEIKLISFFFALITVPLVYSLIVFRRRKGDTGDGQHFEGHTGLEITWTVIPLVLVIWLGIVGADNLRTIQSADPQALEVGVVAHQWDWSFQYPQGFDSDVLYLPVDKQVVLKMQSLDVIHSFWVPEFRVKQDIVPGRVVDYRITPDLIGDFTLRCAELCGLKHELMEKTVRVVSQADYDKWVAVNTQKAIAQATASAGHPDPARGQTLYTQLGCKTCHSLDGSKGIGPTWKGLFGSKVSLADDTTVTADQAYLAESIKVPSAKTVAGFSANAMPNFGLILKDSQIADLVAFIMTVK